MRVFSNMCLSAAAAARRMGPIFRFFVAAAVKVRVLEARWFKPDIEVARAIKEEEDANRLRAALRKAVPGPPSARLSFSSDNSLSKVIGEFQNQKRIEDENEDFRYEKEDVRRVSKEALAYLVCFGDKWEHEEAKQWWTKQFPNYPVPPATVDGYRKVLADKEDYADR